MKKLSEQHIIIFGIKTENTFNQIINVLKAHGIEPTDWDYDTFHGCRSDSIRVNHGVASHLTEDYYRKYAYSRDFIHADGFLLAYQVPFTYGKYEGSYELEGTTWHGKILHINDLVTYESSSLVGLEHEFIKATKDYEETLEKLKGDNMEDYVINKDPTYFNRGWYIRNNVTDMYLFKDGTERPNIYSLKDNQAFWPSKEEAEEFLEEFTRSDDAADSSLISKEHVSDWQRARIAEAVDHVVEMLMEDEKAFTRHDIIKCLRTLFGEGVEIEYNDYKNRIIDVIENEYLLAYEYTQEFDGTKWTYSCIRNYDDVDDILENDDADDSPVADPAKDPKRQLVDAQTVKHLHCSPGDKILVIGLNGNIVLSRLNDLDSSLMHMGIHANDVVTNVTYTVDKNYNIKIGRWVFEVTNTLGWMGSKIDWI